jgi:hypothetical protein
VRQDAKVTGAQAWRDALHIKGLAVDRAGSHSTTRAVRAVQREVQLTLRIYTHAPGTPTTSPPGGPPAWITGGLTDSVHVTPTVLLRRGVHVGRVGPRAVQSRAQELGYRRGKLPPRPYLKPTTRAMKATIRRIYRDSWAEAMRV